MVKKSYNPFKMWGSYVGLGISIIWVVLATIMLLAFVLGSSVLDSSDVPISHSDFAPQFFLPLLPLIFSNMGVSFLISSIMFIISGFLIGWGIHSLVRKLRK